MESAAGSVKVERTHSCRRARPVGGLRYDWAVTALCGWVVGGFYLDAWAHNHDTLESFFQIAFAIVHRDNAADVRL